MKNIKLISDAAEGTSTDDILGKDYSNTDLSYPLLPESQQTFEVVSVTKEPYKSSDGEGLVIKLKTTKENRDVKSGDVLNAGFPATKRIGLTLSEKYTETSREKALAAFVQAAGRPLMPLETWVGVPVEVKVTIGKDDPKYGQQNEFRFVPLKKK